MYLPAAQCQASSILFIRLNRDTLAYIIRLLSLTFIIQFQVSSHKGLTKIKICLLSSTFNSPPPQLRRDTGDKLPIKELAQQTYPSPEPHTLQEECWQRTTVANSRWRSWLALLLFDEEKRFRGWKKFGRFMVRRDWIELVTKRPSKSVTCVFKNAIFQTQASRII